MLNFLVAVLTQSLLFLPLALGISVSYNILRATDMTIDGSFVLGAAVFARLLQLGFPISLAFFFALLAGALAGVLVAIIQRHGRIDPLLAGVLATFILSSVNLSIMGKPNISLLSQETLVSSAFNQSDFLGWLLVFGLVFLASLLVFMLLRTGLGLRLRAFGDNPLLLQRLGLPLETFRIAGFALTNTLSAFAGCLMAQIVGYADIGMGLGVTLTGIGAIILGRQLFSHLSKRSYFRVGSELIACLLGVILYFSTLNTLLRLDIDPTYLKMIIGVILIFFLRAAVKKGEPSA